MSSDVSYVDKYITRASHTQKGWRLNIWASASCCNPCLCWLATPLYSHLFRLSELLAYAKNTCECDHLYATHGVELLPFGRVGEGKIAVLNMLFFESMKHQMCLWIGVHFRDFPYTFKLIRSFFLYKCFLSTNCLPGSMWTPEKMSFWPRFLTVEQGSQSKQTFRETQKAKWGLMRKKITSLGALRKSCSSDQLNS